MCDSEYISIEITLAWKCHLSVSPGSLLKERIYFQTDVQKQYSNGCIINEIN